MHAHKHTHYPHSPFKKETAASLITDRNTHMDNKSAVSLVYCLGPDYRGELCINQPGWITAPIPAPCYLRHTHILDTKKKYVKHTQDLTVNSLVDAH